MQNKSNKNKQPDLDAVTQHLHAVNSRLINLIKQGKCLTPDYLELVHEQGRLIDIQSKLMEEKFWPCANCKFRNTCPFSNKETFENNYLICPKKNLSKNSNGYNFTMTKERAKEMSNRIFKYLN